MGSVQQAVLEFDEEIQAPWRPRLVPPPDAGATASVRPPLSYPSRRSPSRVGVCRPPAAPARPVDRRQTEARRAGERSGMPGGPGPARPLGGHASAPRRTVPARVRLTRRARRLAVVLALAAGVGLGSWLGPLLGGGGGDLRLAGESSVVVRAGDTLWSIASELDGEGDVRALIDEIQELNGLEGAEIRPGQTLLLP